MATAEKIEELLQSQMGGVESSLAQEALETAVLQTQIASIDDTLYVFRDLAGSYLQKGDGDLMARYRSYKYKLDNLVIMFQNRTSIDLSNRLKCNK